MRKVCKPIERQMLAGTGRESFLGHREFWMDSEGLVRFERQIHFVCPDFIEHLF